MIVLDEEISSNQNNQNDNTNSSRYNKDDTMNEITQMDH
jgi:hypothetical protein